MATDPPNSFSRNAARMQEDAYTPEKDGSAREFLFGNAYRAQKLTTNGSLINGAWSRGSAQKANFASDDFEMTADKKPTTRRLRGVGARVPFYVPFIERVS